MSALDEVESAVVRIVAEGSFIDPQLGARTNVAGSGSGFLIDESGIAVTNNHVVAGAAFIQVFVGGDNRPRNARVLGVSECSDLAVIDIDGEGYPFLEWFDGALSVGTEVYVAGLPLGDPQFTLTRGIISKERADGETIWASVDSVVEHDAQLNPGNSGGPLVTADGRVVGVNYAGVSSTGQSFAISRNEALPVIERLRSGESVNSIGINGEAVFSSEDGISGIWVASVDSGSPADRLGVRPGDIITQLEGLVLSTDGTMADYCDILRSNAADAVLAIQVLRFETDEVLEGRLNDSPLVLSFSIQEELEDETPGDGGATPAAEYTNFVNVFDDSGVIGVRVPAAWSDLDGTPTAAGSPSIVAATSTEGFRGGWTAPGVWVVASRFLDTSQLDELFDSLAEDYRTQCSRSSDVDDYSDPLYTGLSQVFGGCGGTDTRLVLVVATPEDRSFAIVVTIQVVTDRDVTVVDGIIDTFQVLDPDF